MYILFDVSSYIVVWSRWHWYAYSYVNIDTFTTVGPMTANVN